MGRNSKCYISSFVEIGLPVPEKKIFEGFLPYMGVVAILLMWYQLIVSLLAHCTLHFSKIVSTSFNILAMCVEKI